MINYRSYANPYDFANPVDDIDLFAGRSLEIKEIDYYLDHATKAKRSINLALIGDRASGKTSLLNIVQVMAEEKDICVVRVDLDESISESSIIFFYKIFDSLLTTVCSSGLYGGLQGKTYETYRDMVDSFEIPSDRTFCSFQFPFQYAKTVGTGNVNAAPSDALFKRDIVQIRSLLGKPIAILIDEGDILSRNRIHLQMIRNIFMNIAGYMLIITGTPNLFPIMSEVFSPVIRQFKRINVTPFNEVNETKDCILKPLISIGIDDPESIFESETYRDVSDIHNLTGGRPYEIQLICHFLFKRLQSDQAVKMELSIDVLDDVLTELQKTQDITKRYILNKIREFTEEEQIAFSYIFPTDDSATFDQIWFRKKVIFGDEDISEERLRDFVKRLSNDEIIVIDSKDEIIFIGDDFDKIYCKYYLRKSGILIWSGNIPFEMLTTFDINNILTKNPEYIIPFRFVSFGTLPDINIEDSFDSFLNNADEMVSMFVNSPEIAEHIYWACIDSRDDEEIEIASITIIEPRNKSRQLYRINQNKPKEDAQSIYDILQPYRNRAQSLGGDIKVDICTVPVIPMGILISSFMSNASKQMIDRMAENHISRMMSSYFRRNDIPDAVFHMSIVVNYQETPDNINNLGYLLLSARNIEEALPVFERALKLWIEEEDNSGIALSTYNLAVLDFIQQRLDDAESKLRRVIEVSSTITEDKRTVVSLFIPNVTDNEPYGLLELNRPDLHDTAEMFLRIITDKNTET